MGKSIPKPEPISVADWPIFQPILQAVRSIAMLLGQMHGGRVNVYAVCLLLSPLCVLIVQLLL